MKIIETKSAPAAIGPYSQAIIANGFVYTSGQISLNPQTGSIEADGIEAQSEQAIKNLGEILKAAGKENERERYLVDRAIFTKQLIRTIAGYKGIIAGRMHSNIMSCIVRNKLH